MKEFLLFVGQNASTGKPNKRTGLYSFYGKMLKFSHKEEREAYCIDRLYTPGEIIQPGTRTTLRKYDLGSSLQKYNEYIDQLPYTGFDFMRKEWMECIR